jgi:hypothetical protein
MKNGVCCYTWGEKRAIGSKKRTMLLHFGRSKPLNAAKTEHAVTPAGKNTALKKRSMLLQF